METNDSAAAVGAVEQVGAPQSEKPVMAKKAAIRGVPASSRTWKLVQTKRTSAMGRPSGPPKNSGIAFKASMAAKKARLSMKEMQDRLRAERKEQLEELKQKRLDKQRRRAEGEMRAAQMQTLDPAKIKKMNKKQLRQVKKTRINAKTGAVELVSAYS